MANFWLTKRALLEALNKEYTVVKIDVNGKQKTIKEEFEKLLLKNEDNLSLEFDKTLKKA